MSWSVVDLFSGPGGMSSGFLNSAFDFTHLGAVDLQKGKPGKDGKGGTTTGCNATYEKNIGVTPFNEDISQLDPRKFRERLEIEQGDLGVLISCAPCTGFSQKMAKNHFEDDSRNQLVSRSALFVREFMPEFFVMENVKELLNGKHRHHFHKLHSMLESLGYRVDAQVYDFSKYGLPQKRIRAVIVASREGIGLQALTKNDMVSRVSTVADLIRGLPELDHGQIDPNDPMHACPSHTEPVLARMQAIPANGGSWADIIDSHPHLLIPSMLNKRDGSFPDVYGRMWWDRPAPTITRECASPGNGRYTHPEQNRLLTVREMALLQGFPADYVFEGTLTQRYNQIGDSVPPMIATKIANNIAAAKNASNSAKLLKANHQPSLF
ncbi:DNA cytosine methyltransferase [Deinococcus sp. RM]|uniref:DNA cytosine methyltransferase n=1 Tax=Deinococcus sp. RM TaxID=2316359 RepID=UPI000E68E0B6|nr:DNA cytosine methyltransferase [Deinococcus sp. RM]RIY09209.1 DNA cytosine methyltransferase [Deinococcus sp. RM]